MIGREVQIWIRSRETGPLPIDCLPTGCNASGITHWGRTEDTETSRHRSSFGEGFGKVRSTLAGFPVPAASLSLSIASSSSLPRFEGTPMLLSSATWSPEVRRGTPRLSLALDSPFDSAILAWIGDETALGPLVRLVTHCKPLASRSLQVRDCNSLFARVGASSGFAGAEHEEVGVRVGEGLRASMLARLGE